MPSIALAWENKSVSIDGQRLYRSNAPIELTNLPPVLTTLPGDANKFMDDSVVVGEKYWYVVEAHLGNRSEFSDVFEIEVTNPKPTGPGSKDLVDWNNKNWGFFGEVPGSELITFNDLTTRVGVTEGTAQNLTDPWLKFVLDGKILFVSKRTIRHSISWNHLNTRNVVYGNTVIDILGEQYKVRLLTGADTDPTPAIGYYVEGSHNSEWSRLFYPLVNDDMNLPFEIRNPNAPYTNLQLGMVTENGRSSWCQEVHQWSANYRVLRGSSGVAYLGYNSSSSVSSNYGWRPCLELVQ